MQGGFGRNNAYYGKITVLFRKAAPRRLLGLL